VILNKARLKDKDKASNHEVMAETDKAKIDAEAICSRLMPRLWPNVKRDTDNII